MSMLLQLICGILITVLSLTVFFMLRHMRKYPPQNSNSSQNVAPHA